MSKRNPTCGCGEEGICNDAPLECHPCCRCVPQRLCATLPSYDAVMMELAGNGEYTGTISCGAETMDLHVFLQQENGTCYWRVVSEEFSIDEWFEIDGTEGRTCEKPILEIESPFYECPGTMTIQKHLLVNLPIVFDENGCPHPFCEDRQCLPQCLCVDYVEQTGDDTCLGSGRLCWDEYTMSWSGEIEMCAGEYLCGDIEVVVSLDQDEYTGECLLTTMVSGRIEFTRVSPLLGTEISLFFEIEDPYSKDSIILGISSEECVECPICSVATSCCPRLIPATLIATFIGEDTCPCAHEVQITLENQGGSPLWRGRGEVCGKIWQLTLECDGAFSLQVLWDGPPLTFCPDVIDDFSCNPLELLFDFTGAKHCMECDAPDTGFHVLVTE